MAADLHFTEYVVDQIKNAGSIEFKQMFGGITLYCNAKVVGLICDNKLFIKPTNAGRLYIGDVVEAPPYTGAKHYFLIEEQIENSDWITELIIVTAKELPQPKPKKKSKKKK